MISNLLWFLWQGEIPRPKDTAPGERWGLYTLQDFWLANWYYMSAIVLLALIVIVVARQKKKSRRLRKE